MAVDEAEFRHFLQAAEGRLGMLQLTTEDVRGSAKELLREIEGRVRAHLG